jgi:hypothetical protein
MRNAVLLTLNACFEAFWSVAALAFIFVVWLLLKLEGEE